MSGPGTLSRSGDDGSGGGGGISTERVDSGFTMITSMSSPYNGGMCPGGGGMPPARARWAAAMSWACSE